MIKECRRCINNDNFRSATYELKELLNWIESVDNNEQKQANHLVNESYSLTRCKACGIHWEWRPLFKETMYGGEPGEWIKVTNEYVKEHYGLYPIADYD